jgi:hypothetical protein
MVLDDNMFIAEFESEADKKRVLDGSPWYIGRQAVGRQVVILQNFDYGLRQRKEWYDVVHERVPFFCFSCGIIGHSECPTPAIRDEKGFLPYSEKLRAPEERRLRTPGEWHTHADNLSRRNNSSGVRASSESKKSS